MRISKKLTTALIREVVEAMLLLALFVTLALAGNAAWQAVAAIVTGRWA